MEWLKAGQNCLIIHIYVQPKASVNRVIGPIESASGTLLKIRLTAPPADGKANAMCLAYLSKCLKRPKSSLHIISGKTGRIKRIRIDLPKNEKPEPFYQEVVKRISATFKANKYEKTNIDGKRDSSKSHGFKCQPEKANCSEGKKTQNQKRSLHFQ